MHPSWISDWHTKVYTHLIEDHPRNIQANFAAIWFRGLEVSEKKNWKMFFPKFTLLNLSCDGGHQGFPIHKTFFFTKDHPMNIHVQFWLNQISSFWEKKLLFLFWNASSWISNWHKKPKHFVKVLQEIFPSICFQLVLWLLGVCVSGHKHRKLDWEP